MSIPRRKFSTSGRASAVWIGLFGLMLFAWVPSRAAITLLNPFQGTLSEGFDHLGITGAQQEVSIFDRTASVTNLTQGGALKLEYSSSLNGVLVTPRSAPLMLGQIGISEWVFNTPLSEFGGYFQNNSRFDDATVDFYDLSDTLIGSLTASVPKNRRAWTWNGWQSDIPIHRIVITGNDVAFYHGFIWFDDVQAMAIVPEPSSLPLLGLAGVLLSRRLPKQSGATAPRAD
jgi:hypothetical protein